MNIIDVIESLASEYGLRPSTVKKYYDMLKENPMFKDEDAEKCLAIVCEERVYTAVQIQVIYQNRKNGLMSSKRKMKFKSLNQTIEDTIQEVYADYYNSMANSSSMIYDETEYDVMERDDQIEDTFWAYADEIDDIRTKDREAYERNRKKNDVRK